MNKTSLWISSILVLIIASFAYCQHDKKYTFINPRSSFAQYSVPWIPEDEHGARLRFKTVQGNALLYYQEYRNLTNPKYALWIELVNRELRITHLYNQFEESIYLGKALDDDIWHTVTYERKSNGLLYFTVDNQTSPVKYLDAYDSGGAEQTFAKLSMPSYIFIGGLWQNMKTPANRNFTHFVGCFQTPELLISKSFRPFTMYNSTNLVQEGCVNKCDMENACKNGGKCVNRYTSTICDCSHTGFIGWNCDISDDVVITLQGEEYLEYKVNTKSENTYSSSVYLHISFKMEHEQRSGVLVYGHSFSPGINYVAIEIVDGELMVSINFGYKALHYHFNETKVNDNSWYDVILQHEATQVTVSLTQSLNGVLYTRNDTLPQLSYLNLGETVYIGGGSVIRGYEGLILGSDFIGCLKHVTFGLTNILEELTLSRPLVKYLGKHEGRKPEHGCRDRGHSSIIFPTSRSQLILKGWNDGNLNLRFQLKTIQRNAILFLVAIRDDNGIGGKISLNLLDNRVQGVLELEKENDFITYTMVVGEHLNNTMWHTVEFSIMEGSATLIVDAAKTSFQTTSHTLTPTSDLYLGGGWNNTGQGFEGCMQEITFQAATIYPNEIMNTNMVNGVTIGSCQVTDPCLTSDLACENNGRCGYNSKEGGVRCDCSGTGYSGPTCHFPIFKRTCGEYYFSGDRISGLKRIDIDGVGKFPPVNVLCDFRNDKIVTIIEHNFEDESEVRSVDWGPTTYQLQYRDMTGGILKFLVDHADYCQQDIKYWCWQAPLSFGIGTIFTSPRGKTIRSANMTNNCNANKDGWLYDEGVLNVKKDLPVVRMDFSQENNKVHTLARMSLGALQCNGIIGYTGGYILTFLKSNAILKFQKPWEKGTLSLSFRTARYNSVIFHQLPSKTNTNNLMAKVYDDHTMEFSYRQNGRKGVVHLKTTRQLTDRDWHLITIEQSPKAIRFTIDMDNEVVMLKEGEKVKAYGGPFLLGGSLSTEVMDDPNVQGMVGCIAGLIINNRVVYLADIYSIQRRVVREGMAVGCNTLCHENTCKNGGRCIERFTSYECICLDRATSGDHCEINYNDDVVNFPEGNTYLSIDLTHSSIFTSSFFVGFRTLNSNALLLYAEDNFSNFVSLEIIDGQLKMTWNSNRVIRNIILKSEVRKFSDGDWLEVSVERDEQGVSVIVGNEKVTTLAPLGLLDRFYSDPFLEGIAKPSASNQFVKLYVGGKPNSDVNALKGCIRGLVVGNRPIKLQGSYTPGVLDRCEHHCLPRPCLNGGICMETWYDFYCNCTMTSYAGKQCEEEIGAFFHDSTGIMAKLNQPSTPDTPSLEVDYLLISFSTNGGSGVMAYVRSARDIAQQEYIVVYLTEVGNIVAKVNIGNNEYIVQDPDTYNDGYRHLIILRRYGNRIMMSVDNKKSVYEDMSPAGSDIQFMSRDLLVVGGIESNLTGFGLEGLTAYDGCLTGVDYNGNKPIKTFYMSTAAIEDTSESLKKGICAAFLTPIVVVPSAPTSIEQPKITLPPWNVSPAKPIITSASTEEKNDPIVTLFVAILLTVIIVLLLICNVCTGIEIKVSMDEDRERKRQQEDEEQALMQTSDGYELSDLVLKRTGGVPTEVKTLDELTNGSDILKYRDSLREELEWDPLLDKSKLQQAASPTPRDADYVIMENEPAPLIDFTEELDVEPIRSPHDFRPSVPGDEELPLEELDAEPIRSPHDFRPSVPGDEELPLQVSRSSSSSSDGYAESSSAIMDTSPVATIITLPDFEQAKKEDDEQKQANVQDNSTVESVEDEGRKDDECESIKETDANEESNTDVTIRNDHVDDDQDRPGDRTETENTIDNKENNDGEEAKIERKPSSSSTSSSSSDCSNTSSSSEENEDRESVTVETEDNKRNDTNKNIVVDEEKPKENAVENKLSSSEESKEEKERGLAVETNENQVGEDGTEKNDNEEEVIEDTGDKNENIKVEEDDSEKNDTEDDVEEQRKPSSSEKERYEVKEEDADDGETNTNNFKVDENTEKNDDKEEIKDSVSSRSDEANEDANEEGDIADEETNENIEVQ